MGTENRGRKKLQQKKKKHELSFCNSTISVYYESQRHRLQKATQCFVNIPCVKDEKSYSFPVCVGDTDGTGDGDWVLLAAEVATPLTGVTWPIGKKLQKEKWQQKIKTH